MENSLSHCKCKDRDTKTGNRSLENVAQFKYLGVTAINRKLYP
jgi:hypothetical protein